MTRKLQIFCYYDKLSALLRNCNQKKHSQDVEPRSFSSFLRNCNQKEHLQDVEPRLFSSIFLKHKKRAIPSGLLLIFSYTHQVRLFCNVVKDNNRRLSSCSVILRSKHVVAYTVDNACRLKRSNRSLSIIIDLTCVSEVERTSR